MHFYPDNTVNRYTTRLENGIALSGDWEVGLVEMQYPHSWFNLERGEGRLTYLQVINIRNRPTHLQHVTRLPSGYYDSVTDLVQAINDNIKDYAEKFELVAYPKFKYNKITKRLNADINGGASVHFSPALSTILGIHSANNSIINTTDAILQWKAAGASDINRGFSSMYVYCNVLEHVAVGDTKAPLLRIVHISGKGDDNAHVIYEKPLYVPLQRKNFDSIEIDIRSDTGNIIPFENGKVIVTLHFRRCKIPYLLQ